MKQLYVRVLLLSVLSSFVVHQYTAAQCNCSGGVPATPIEHRFELAPTDAPTSQLIFPQFDASIGTLTCIVFRDTIHGTTTTTVRNKAGFPVEYTFLLTVSNTFKGPGGSFTHIQPVSTTYGPDVLDTYGEPGDIITYGPDPLFEDLIGVINLNTSLSPYIGTGNVIIEYSINGGVISLDGGLNYEFDVETIYSGSFSLTYYWCPASPLNNNIRNFAAYNKDGLVHLSWFGADEI
ncbi:MAG TPA: choice-of-anchor E domain-containing protein, partial [Parasegetibacter sp.]